MPLREYKIFFSIRHKKYHSSPFLMLINVVQLLFEYHLPSLQHRPGKRVAVRGQKHVHVVNSGNKAHISLLACVSASGYAIPPMVIFQQKTLTPHLTTQEVPGTIYGLSASGWMDRELFQEWFHRHFLQHVPSSRPLLLVLDGHSSHYSLEFIREATLEGVIVFCLPSHTTLHYTATGCFGLSLTEDILGF